MVIKPTTVVDAAEILALQKLAYQSEAEIHHGPAIPPLTQSLEEIESDFQRRTFLKTAIEGRITGSARAHLREGTCYIGRLIVHPNHQNLGIGTKLIPETERRFAEAKRYELFTVHRSDRSLCLYGKLGYRPVRRQRLSDKVVLVFLEKPGSDRGESAT